jgi:MFS family permease
MESSTIPPASSSQAHELATKPTKRARFWIIFVANGLTAILTALEATIVSTALPDIVASLRGGNSYVWVANGYLLAMYESQSPRIQRKCPLEPDRVAYRASLQPMFGQLANVFGRRWPLIFSTSAFLLGSGICGGYGADDIPQFRRYGADRWANVARFQSVCSSWGESLPALALRA